MQGLEVEEDAAMTVFPRLYHLYKMTAATVWYDQPAELQREFERHFEVSRRGSLRQVRRTLARKGVPFLQREIYRRHGIWIPRSRIRVNFEKEEVAAAGERAIRAIGNSMRYRGKKWSATPLPVRVIPYVKRKRKHAKKKRA
jgi:hypothetical protein